MHRLTLLLFFSFFALTKINGQTVTVSGKVQDTIQDKPVENAVVALLFAKDSVLYKFTRTDATGKFSMNNLQPGN